jgi:hypothetical protein
MPQILATARLIDIKQTVLLTEQNTLQVEVTAMAMPELVLVNTLLLIHLATLLHSGAMTMLSDSPYRQMKQCLAQIDQKRNAITETYFKIKKNKIRITKWEESDNEIDAVRAEEARVAMEQGKVVAENVMKEIGMYQDIYDQIRTAHNIPIDWDEEDFETQEIQHALRMAFRQAIQPQE